MGAGLTCTSVDADPIGPQAKIVPVYAYHPSKMQDDSLLLQHGTAHIDNSAKTGRAS